MNQIGSSNIFGDLNIDGEARTLLLTIVKWAKIAAVAGLLSAGLTLIGAVLGIIESEGSGKTMTAVMTRAALMLIIPLAISMIALNIFLVRFASSTGQSLDSANQGVFNQGIKFLKLYFNTFGVIIIVAIILVIVGIIAFAMGVAVG